MNLLDLAKNLFQTGEQKVQQTVNPIWNAISTNAQQTFNPATFRSMGSGIRSIANYQPPAIIKPITAPSQQSLNPVRSNPIANLINVGKIQVGANARAFVNETAANQAVAKTNAIRFPNRPVAQNLAQNLSGLSGLPQRLLTGTKPSLLTPEEKKQLTDFTVNVGGFSSGISAGRSTAMTPEQINYFKNLPTEARSLIGKFAQVVESNPSANRKNMGQLGDYIQTVLEESYGQKAANLTNKQVKNLLDLSLQTADAYKGKIKFTIGLNASDARENLPGKVSAGSSQQASLKPSQILEVQPPNKKSLLTPEKPTQLGMTTPSRPYINTNKLNVSDKSKEFVDASIEEVKPAIEKFTGQRLSNKQAVDLADNSARVLNRAVSQKETLEWEAKMLKARQLLAQQATDGKITQEYIDNLIAVKSQGSDIARKLQSMSITADPKEVTAKQAILEAILRVTDDSANILEKAKGVDFNDYEQAASFYRQFVEPTKGDWLDKVRYSSMLSSPNTHVNNFSSNYQGTGIIAPVEKTLTGSLDWLFSAVKPGRQRQQFAGEGAAYAKGYYSNTGKAWDNFTSTLTGKKQSSAQELYSLPLTQKGTFKRGVENVLSVPGKMLQAADEFFTTLTSGGVESQLKYRQSKGIKVLGLEEKAYLESRKRLFNSAFGLKEDGPLLKAIEFIPMKVAEARASSNPVISTVAKYTFPFVKVPANILKASIEYSPIGLSTIPGAANKAEQLSKSILGTSIGLATATLVASDRMTWAEPTDEKKRNAFRAAGLQPFAVKVGDKWVSYSKMHPAIAFNLALVAAVRDAEKNRTLDDGQVETVLNGVAKWVNFYASMSYVKNIGDAVSGVQGDLDAGTRQISNYAQQFIPFRALMGWVARIVDPYQRQVDKDGSILDKQLQQISTQIPGLSENVPARVDAKGNLIENPHRIINAVSPFRITTENPEAKKTYNLMESKTRNTRQENIIKENVLDTGKEQVYNGKKYYLSKELDTKTGEYTPMVKSIKVSQTSSDVYQNLDKEYETSPDSPKNLIQKVGVYGAGIFKDPKGTINAIKSGQPVRKVRGDAVVVERLKNLSSLDQGDKATEVDHVIPIALGGDNSESNLAIISKQDNRAKGVVDTYLAKELESGRITKKEAQQRDLNWRQEINNLPSGDKQKALAILSSAPEKSKEVSGDTLTALAAREFEPIYNDSTQSYSKVSIKIPETPKLSGLAELDKGLKSKYKSALSTARTNIQKLYLDEQLTAKEANEALLALNTSKSKYGGGSNGKKITIKKVFYKPIKITKVKTLKVKKLPKLKLAKQPKVKITKQSTLKAKKPTIKIKLG